MEVQLNYETDRPTMVTATAQPVATDWRQRHAEILEGLWKCYDNEDEFDPNAVACTLGLAEEIRLSIAAGLLDPVRPAGAGPATMPAGALVHGSRSACRYRECGATIVYTIVGTSRGWSHDDDRSYDHAANW